MLIRPIVEKILALMTFEFHIYMLYLINLIKPPFYYISWGSEINDWFRLILDRCLFDLYQSLNRLPIWKSQIAVCFLWLSLTGDCRVTDEALLAETT